MSVIKNEDLLENLEKADAQLSDLYGSGNSSTTGGALAAEQANRFVRLVVKQGVMTKMATVKSLRAQRFQLPKARFGSRVLHAAHVAKAFSAAERSQPDLSQIELDTKKFKAEVRLSYELLEDSVEREVFADTVMALLADAISRDIDEIALLSDTTGSTVDNDPDLMQFDGLIPQAASNGVPAGGASLNREVLRDMMKTMPPEYFRNKAKMAFLTSVGAEIDYRDSLAQRSTELGDIALGALTQSPSVIKYNGIPVVPLHLIPETYGAGQDETIALLLEPKQIQFGFQRKITLEMERDIVSQQVIMVLSTRFDVKYTHEDAVVKAEEIQVSA